MIFKNWVHYHEFQRLEFSEGLNLIIGGNNSGKSVIFEIIRRCMSTNLSATITSSYGESNRSFAICKFSKVPGLGVLFSGICRYLEEETRQFSYVKFIIYKLTDEIYSCCANKYICKENVLMEDTVLASEKLDITNETKWKCIYNFLKNEELPQDVNTFEEEIVNLCKGCDFQIKEENECQNKLKELDNRFVATFPMRSIGPAQWTKSSRVNAKLRVENEELTNERAEIIHSLFVNEMSGFDRKLSDENLRKLTHPKQYRLSREEIGDKTHVRINDQSLLRTPEGIVEAVQFALISSCKDFNTICLEEPDRGMHTQMVERLCDIISGSKDKVFLIISHNTSFVNRWTIPFTFVCVPERSNQQKPIHRVISLKLLDEPMKANVQTLADTDDLRKILFSSNILCVEGKVDKILIYALFDYLIDRVNHNDFIQIGEIEISRNEIHYISSHQIVALGSHTMEGPVRRCCEILEVKCTSLLDLDAFVKSTDKKKESLVRVQFEECERASSFEDLKIFCETQDGFKKLAKLKEEKRIFFWKVGRLEEVILKCLSNEQIKKHFKSETDLRHLSEWDSADKNMKKSLKKCLLGLPRHGFKALIQDLVEFSEIVRFINLMKRMYSVDSIEANVEF